MRRRAHAVTARLDAGQCHGGGKTAALDIADHRAVNTPGEQGKAVKRAPAAQAQSDKLPRLDPAQQGGGNCVRHKNPVKTMTSNNQAK